MPTPGALHRDARNAERVEHPDAIRIPRADSSAWLLAMPRVASYYFYWTLLWYYHANSE